MQGRGRMTSMHSFMKILRLTAPVDFNDTVPALSYEIKYAEVPASVFSSFTVSTVSNIYKD